MQLFMHNPPTLRHKVTFKERPYAPAWFFQKPRYRKNQNEGYLFVRIFAYICANIIQTFSKLTLHEKTRLNPRYSGGSIRRLGG